MDLPVDLPSRPAPTASPPSPDPDTTDPEAPQNDQDTPSSSLVVTPDISSDDEKAPSSTSTAASSTGATQGSASPESPPPGSAVSLKKRWMLMSSDPFSLPGSSSGRNPRFPPLDPLSTDDLPWIRYAHVHFWTPQVIGVIGVGYVGEHLVNVFSRMFKVIAFDISPARVNALRVTYQNNPKVTVTSDEMELVRATHFLISVPTLLRPDNTVDSSYLEAALQLVRRYGRRGATVVIESSVAVGMTRRLLGPIAYEGGFYAGMSPERVDPGRTNPPANQIPKVISGLDDVVPGSLHKIQKIYSAVFSNVVPVSSPEVAEMMKLYENCQRMVCIAYANEMADACVAHGINPFEVCAAAATKPFGYMPMTPSLGVGGHCIPVNPYYLLANSNFPLLRAATEKMRARPAEIASRAVNLLTGEAHQVNSSSSSSSSSSRKASEPTPSSDEVAKPRVLVVGMGFKVGQSHLVNSPGLACARSLASTGRVNVSWADPLVAQAAIPDIPRLHVEDWNVGFLRANFDMIIVAFRQNDLDFSVLENLKDVRVEMWCR